MLRVWAFVFGWSLFFLGEDGMGWLRGWCTSVWGGGRVCCCALGVRPDVRVVASRPLDLISITSLRTLSNLM